MTLVDWLVLGAYFAIMIMIIWWVTRQKDETSTDYFLAGRNAGWIAIGASIFASNIGSEHLVGLAGAGAKSGMAMAHWEMHGWLILVLGWVFVPFYARSRVFTMPEFLERRYNTASRNFLSIISLVSYVLTKVAVTVYAGGIVFQEVFGITEWQGIDFFWISAVGLVLVTGIYTVLGGMKAILYTSIIQVPVMLLGCLFILVFGLRELGGWNELMEIAGATVTPYGDSMTSLIRSHNDPEFPWTGVLLGSAIIGFWYWCTDQYIVQRVLSGQSQKQARRGTILGAYLKLTPVFLFLIPGMIAFALNQKGLLELSNPDAAFSSLVTHILPVGLRGLVVGGLIAALMSSLASLFNSSAILFTKDFYEKLRPGCSEKHLVKVGRIATAVIVILGILWIPVMQGIGKVLYAYLQSVQSLLAPGIASVFLIGIFWKRATPKAGFAGLLAGFILGMTRLAGNVFEPHINPDSLFYTIILQHNWLHYSIYLFFLCICVIVIVSLLTKRPDASKIASITYGSATPEQVAETRASWDKWDVLNSVIILTIIVLFYIFFW
ncbi:MAG TPA: sodium:solute symporter [Bacteroidales bacterium]|nr:sodium:solute symporter [Bacteroidales bacterium]